MTQKSIFSLVSKRSKTIKLKIIKVPPTLTRNPSFYFCDPFQLSDK